jgi:hypothetical protein
MGWFGEGACSERGLGGRQGETEGGLFGGGAELGLSSPSGGVLGGGLVRRGWVFCWTGGGDYLRYLNDSDSASNDRGFCRCGPVSGAGGM